MPIVDSHVHIWTTDPAYPWPDPNDPPTDEDRSAEQLLELMEANSVEKTVLVQPIYDLWNNRYVIDAAKEYPGKFMAVGRVNPEDPANADQLSMWTEDHGLHGVRLSPHPEGDGDWFDGPLMPPLFARAQELGVPMLILTGPRRLDRLADLADSYADLDICIDHMAEVALKDKTGKESLLAMARYPRVYVKISHTWSLSAQDYPWADTHGRVADVYQSFGARRLMWGTDWPVCLSKTDYAGPLKLVRDEMRFFEAEDLEWILGRTALQLWSFGEEPP